MLQAEGLESDVLHGVGLQLSPGEILGVGGLVGQGQDALLKSLFGDHPLIGGTITVAGQRRDCENHPTPSAIASPMVPQERKAEGLLLQKSMAVNLSLAILRRTSAGAGPSTRGANSKSFPSRSIGLKIRAASGAEPVGALSGGNQQKVLLQKWLLTKPTVLLLNDVTRGVDIGTKTQIYDIVVELAASGSASCSILPTHMSSSSWGIVSW